MVLGVFDGVVFVGNLISEKKGILRFSAKISSFWDIQEFRSGELVEFMEENIKGSLIRGISRN